MKYYFLKLLPPRPTFMQDMTPAEGQLMQEHAGYWRGLLGSGYAVGFGPVADPAGAYGMGLLELPEGVDPAALSAEDPVIKANVGFRAEISPMPRAVVRAAPLA
jgi:hypothetical protein